MKSQNGFQRQLTDDERLVSVDPQMLNPVKIQNDQLADSLDQLRRKMAAVATQALGIQVDRNPQMPDWNFPVR